MYNQNTDSDDFEPEKTVKIFSSTRIIIDCQKEKYRLKDDMKLAVALSSSEKIYYKPKIVKLSKYNMCTILPPEEALLLAAERASEIILNQENKISV